ncbi:MAG: divalent cation tolerance protein CutA [Halobacteriota archaeon]
MDAITTVCVTAPSGSASELAETLVEERLSACANRFTCHTTYR